MPGPTPLRQTQSNAAAARTGALVDVVVLSEDLELFQAIRVAVGENNPVWRARSAEESVDLLITGRCGVLLVDLASVTAQPDTLVQQVLNQFPDVVVCVAGLREDEPLLAPLIGEGLIYRFMHKPLSPRRAHMFLQAAIRHHGEKRDGVRLTGFVPDNVVPLPSRYDPLKWVFVATGVALFVMLLSIFVDDRAPATLAAAPATPTVAPVAPAPVQQTTSANPVLSRARAAYEAGRYEAPAGRNALDLYQAVMLSQPDNAEARDGFDKTVERVLGNARMALEAGNLVEAKRLTDRALDADPNRQDAMLLSQQIRRQSEPAPVVAPVMVAPPPVAVANVPTVAPNPSATQASTVSPPVMRPAPAPAAVLLPPVPSKPLPGPVTKLPPIGSKPPPIVATPVVAAAPIVIRPDPLAARIVNAPDPSAPPRPRIYARKVEPLPIAGYAKTREPEPVMAPATATVNDSVPEPPVTNGLVLPADAFEKLVVTDPVYPLAALRTRTSGWVQLEFTITPSGAVRDIAVVEGQPKGVFDQSAAEALAKWRFKPRYVNGQPATQRSTLIMHFDLES